MRLALPRLLALGALSAGALSLPPLEALQRADRALFDLCSRIGSLPAPADVVVIELSSAADQAALIETARWQAARLLVTTLPEAPVVSAGDLPLLGPVAVASASMPILRETAWADGGYLWPRSDLGGVIRYERPSLGELDPIASLSLAAARRLTEPVGHELKASATDPGPAEVDRSGRRWLRFYSPDGLRAIPHEAIRLKPDALTDKVVVVGAADGARHATPVGPLSTAELVAHTLAGYRNGNAVVTNLGLDAAGWLGAVLWIGVIASVPLGSLAGLLLPIAGAVSLIAAGTAVFLAAGMWIPVAGPGLLVLTLTGLAARIGHAPRASRPTPQGEPRTLLDGRRLIALGELAEAWEVFRSLPMSRDVLGETYDLGCALAENGQQQLAADAFHRVAQADAAYKDVARRLVASCADPRSHSPERPKPAALGRYEVLGIIGSGAMSVVYLGHDPSINRIVAIKAIYLEQEFEPVDLDEARARFAREAEIAGRLSHPAIVTIYDIGEQDGIAYIAMEYVRGIHLDEHVSPGTLLPTADVLELTARAAEALDYAHRQNVVHRDIKPANIMYDSATDSLKITDFGVARLMDVSRTRTGIVLGTPSYMSPEQLQGENVNGHTDLFALGVTLYQLLTGRLPFRGTSMTELMFVISNEPHVPVTEIRAELPRVLDDVIGHALAKDPADRFSDGMAMAQALRAALASP